MVSYPTTGSTCSTRGCMMVRCPPLGDSPLDLSPRSLSLCATRPSSRSHLSVSFEPSSVNYLSQRDGAMMVKVKNWLLRSLDEQITGGDIPYPVLYCTVPLSMVAASEMPRDRLLVLLCGAAVTGIIRRARTTHLGQRSAKTDALRIEGRNQE